MRRKKLSLEKIEELDDETYYYIQFMQKQIDESKETIRKLQDYVNSNEEIVHFYSLKKGFNKLVEDYFKKVK